jgi:kynurenine formamidase
MIDLDKYRIIDLSYELVPGERKIDGRYLHGNTLSDRPIEVQEFIAYGARMHFIQGQTHTGTHVECPYKYSETGPDFGTMPLSLFMGEAVACNFTHKKAGEAITTDDFRQAGVKTGDIVLAWGSPETLDDNPYITDEAIDWLVETKIKLIGVENIRHAPPGTPPGQDYFDPQFLLAGIPMLDALFGLDQITRPRVFFIALPVKLRRVTACWARAIALEEVSPHISGPKTPKPAGG